MQKAVNYMRGSVRLEATGPYPERFFNICSARGIRFWGVERVDETTVRLTVPLSQARRAQGLGGRCLCEVRKIGETGAPGFLLRFRTRYGMLAGLALALVTVLVLSRFVLVIEITGNTTVPDGVILAELAEIGLSPGSYGPSLDERAISNRALMDLEELSFLSVNLRGIRAQVVVREADPVPELEPVGVAQDLVAEKSGRVLSVLDLSGQALVSPGDEVTAGDVLISGTVTVDTGEGTEPKSYAVIAKGSVWAEVQECFSAATPLTAAQKAYTGREETQYSVVVLGRTFKISAKTFQPFTYYDKIEQTHSLTLASELILPFSLSVTRCAEYEPTQVAVTRESAEAYLRAQLTARLTQAVGEDGEVLEQSWDVQEENGVLTLTLSASCREQIARRSTNE